MQALGSQKDALQRQVDQLQDARNGAEEHQVQVAALQQKLKQGAQEIKSLENQLSSAASEVDSLKQAVCSRPGIAHTCTQLPATCRVVECELQLHDTQWHASGV